MFNHDKHLVVSPNILTQIIEIAPPLLLAVILHEIAHGYVAYKLGDPTAKNEGRINLNPIVHIDLFMTIILPTLLILSKTGVVFGGAKPVPINPNYFRDPRKGMLWVAIAGPITNIILAAISYLIFYFFGNLIAELFSPFFGKILLAWLISSIFINVVLAIFNMIPIPPLDGGRVVAGILPKNLVVYYDKLEPYGFFVLFFLLYVGIPQKLILPVIYFIQGSIF